VIETKRLILKPLTYEQLVKYLKADHSLETEFNLKKTVRTLYHQLKEAFEQTILPNVADTNKNYLYSTLWTAIDTERNQMVGDICIVGEPNVNGEIEIGYSTYEEFRKAGYMTEAVGGMIEWARSQLEVSSIIASTEKDNIGSFTLLMKNNFIKIGETESLLHWKLNIK